MRTEILKGKPAIGVERLWLLVFLLVAWSVFWPARHAGFVTDWLGGQERYETGMFFQAFHSFGWVAILPVLFTINLALFKLFGTFWLPWFLIFTGLHGLNGWYFYRFVSRIMRGSVASPNSQWLAPAIGGLFLLSPYAVEPIVWKGCIQYPLSLLLLLISLLKVHDFMEKTALAQHTLGAWHILHVHIFDRMEYYCTRYFKSVDSGKNGRKRRLAKIATTPAHDGTAATDPVDRLVFPQ